MPNLTQEERDDAADSIFTPHPAYAHLPINEAAQVVLTALAQADAVLSAHSLLASKTDRKIVADVHSRILNRARGANFIK